MPFLYYTLATNPAMDPPSQQVMSDGHEEIVTEVVAGSPDAETTPSEDQEVTQPSGDSTGEGEETHHEVTMTMETAGEPTSGSQVEEEEDRYDREEDIVRLLLRVVSFLEVNGFASHPILSTLIGERVLSRCGLDTNIRVGYLWKPDAPDVVIPYTWVETFLNGRKDITDLTAFGDKSKYIYVLGVAIGFGEGCLKCEYHRSPPPNTKVVGTDVGDPDTVPPISQIRRAVSNIDEFLSRSVPRVRELYEDAIAKAVLD